MSSALRYALAFLVPLVVTSLITPLAARLARRLGILDHPSQHKLHHAPTPYLGGAALAVGLVVVGSLAAGVSGQILAILLGGIVLGVWGLLDDWVTVRPAVKLLVEASAGIALWLVGIRAGLFGVEALDLALTVLWVVGVTNAVNLVDNMDALASGVAALAAGAFFVIAAWAGDYLVGSFALAVAGASVGFLLHNLPPARIFLGDAGTLMLGFLLAAVGLKLDLVGESGSVRLAVPILILGVPLFDMTLVLVDRLRRRRPIFQGGIDHSSHRLASLGLSHRAVAAVVVGAECACCGAALLLLRLPFAPAVALLATAALLGLASLVLLLRVSPAAVVPPAGATAGFDLAAKGRR